MTKNTYITGAIIALLSSASLAQPAQTPSTALFEMNYSNGYWNAKLMDILPCDSPSKPYQASRTNSEIRLTDYYGKTLYQRALTNPRIILMEDPRENAKLLDKTHFVLRVPVQKNTATFDFYEDAKNRKSNKADASIYVADEIERYYAKGGNLQKAACQIARPELTQKLVVPQPKGAGPSNGISTKTLATFIAKDQDVLIELGVNRGMHPSKVKTLLYKHRDQWGKYGVNSKEVASFLSDYSKAFNKM